MKDTLASAPNGFSPEPEARRVFGEAIDLVHEALVNLYGIPESAASEIERNLEDWFVRFCRRNPLVPPRDGIPQLLALTCSYARGHQQKQLRENLLSPDPDLQLLLARGSAEVAASLRDSSRTPPSSRRGGRWKQLWFRVSRKA